MYLTDVLTKIAAGWPQNRLVDLLPDAWAAAHPKPTATVLDTEDLGDDEDPAP